MPTPSDWNALSQLLASGQRRRVLLALTKPRSPSRLAAKLRLPVPNVSRALGDLRRMRAVVCLNPRRRKGRLYSLTAKGRGLAKALHRLGAPP